MEITVYNLSGEVLHTISVDSSVDASQHIKLVVEDAVRKKISLNRANLIGADLREADLLGADLEGADLSGADLRGAKLIGADLEGADLSGADLKGAKLIGADLRGADMRRADLSGADLYGAKLPSLFLVVQGEKVAYIKADDEFEARYIALNDPRFCDDFSCLSSDQIKVTKIKDY